MRRFFSLSLSVTALAMALTPTATGALFGGRLTATAAARSACAWPSFSSSPSLSFSSTRALDHRRGRHEIALSIRCSTAPGDPFSIPFPLNFILIFVVVGLNTYNFCKKKLPISSCYSRSVRNHVISSIFLFNCGCKVRGRKWKKV